ncbi:metal ABC transporter ATP-binding protein [Corynebacterium uterequi]|uniref:ATPase component of Mn/Zn ABC-type transporter n=1 Tax=Corynebacterium uterequi TaxID=1072256 RepID=A0A0G3HEV7_9CORY|nr:metal ABC transporter ATP-binding protein [Corynebacterium uterequi]AKK11839.1 ATPase component of Mn/Zn ABC-type transporter [Corynebacterium uterequi]
MLVSFRDAAVDPLWSGLNLDIDRGEFLAVLGPNGVGKSTLLGTILGTRELTRGSVSVDARVGFIPQQRMFERSTPLRARDLVSLAVAHGVLRRRRPRRGEVDELLAAVGAEGIADMAVGRLSGGQQQLVRQAQALANNPDLLLADEPLLSLDVARQRDTIERLERRRAELGTSVIVVTHDINPMLHVIDRVVYLAPRGHIVGGVEDVMRSEVLSELYNTPVEVVRVGERLMVV